MLSMLSGILGFATSGLPNVLKFFQEKGNQKHEQEMARLATERSLAMAAKGFASQEKIEESKTNQVNMQTYAQEQPRVGASSEQRAIDEAKRRSMQTYAQDQSRKAASASAEQRVVEEAQRRSLQTYNQEQARRTANSSAEQLEIEEAKRASLQTYAQEQARRNSPAPSPSASNWRLNEGHLVEGGKLVMDLQREIGRTPNRSETKYRLASRMHISHNQADEIIEELGLF